MGKIVKRKNLPTLAVMAITLVVIIGLIYWKRISIKQPTDKTSTQNITLPKRQPRTIMQRKSIADDKAYTKKALLEAQGIYQREPPPPKLEVHKAFFYGSLMDPERLSQVLQLQQPLELRPAFVHDYKCMLWGPYPALVQANGSVVHRRVYQPEKEEDYEKLQYYETDRYEGHGVLISFPDGTKTVGRTFVWAGNERELT